MGTMHSPGSPMSSAASTPQSAPRNPPSTQDNVSHKTPKLRDSCDACAAAKVRCSKRKPCCSRCERRGLECIYLHTRRAGRPSQGTSRKKNKPEEPRPEPDDGRCIVNATLPPSPSCTTPSFLASPRLLDTSHHQSSFPELPLDPLASTDPFTSSSSASSLATFGAELQDFDSSWTAYTGLGTPSHDLLSFPTGVDSVSLNVDPSTTAALIPEDSFPIAEDACSNLHHLTSAQTISSGPSSIPGYENKIPPADPANSSCSCLTTALGFSQKLFPNASRPRPPSDSRSTERPGSPLPLIQAVITENERMVEAVDSILQCSCSQDGYLLTVLSLVVFKVLDWYAAAARAAPAVTTADCTSYMSDPTPHHERRTSIQSASSFCIEGDEDTSRVAAQMVLSELHRAQRLVNELSARFKSHATCGASAVELGAPHCGFDAMDLSPYDGEHTRPFSMNMLDQLEADLRRHLRTVSSKLVEMLRQG